MSTSIVPRPPSLTDVDKTPPLSRKRSRVDVCDDLSKANVVLECGCFRQGMDFFQREIPEHLRVQFASKPDPSKDVDFVLSLTGNLRCFHTMSEERSASSHMAKLDLAYRLCGLVYSENLKFTYPISLQDVFLDENSDNILFKPPQAGPGTKSVEENLADLIKSLGCRVRTKKLRTRLDVLWLALETRDVHKVRQLCGVRLPPKKQLKIRKEEEEEEEKGFGVSKFSTTRAWFTPSNLITAMSAQTTSITDFYDENGVGALSEEMLDACCRTITAEDVEKMEAARRRYMSSEYVALNPTFRLTAKKVMTVQMTFVMLGIDEQESQTWNLLEMLCKRERNLALTFFHEHFPHADLLNLALAFPWFFDFCLSTHLLEEKADFAHLYAADHFEQELHAALFRVQLGEEEAEHAKTVARYLLTEGIDWNDHWNNTFLRAAGDGYLDVLQTLMELPQADPSCHDNLPLQWAAGNGFADVVQYLLQFKGVDPTAQDHGCLTRALDWCHTKVIDVLLAHAVAKDDMKTIELFLSHPRVDFKANGTRVMKKLVEHERWDLAQKFFTLENVAKNFSTDEMLEIAEKIKLR